MGDVPKSSSKSSQQDVKLLNTTKSFIEDTNPEVFEVKPRPGGAINITKVELKPQEFSIAIGEKVSREFRLLTALDETTSIESQEPTLPNPLKDAVFMLGVTLSSIIMLASGKTDLQEAYVDCATKYLECVRDDFGNHPPNVQGMLNYLQLLQEAPAAPPAEEPPPVEQTEDGEEGEQTVRSTTRVRLSQDAQD